MSTSWLLDMKTKATYKWATVTFHTTFIFFPEETSHQLLFFYAHILIPFCLTNTHELVHKRSC